ncbi:MAG TPA: methyltransferase domain-containing protein [Gaiellaceae bacterium]|nr:methyltransferase domain-containing protein [Gaiellaceae bacterium]
MSVVAASAGLELLRCPTCRGALDGDGTLACAACGRTYPVVDGIPRLLDETVPGVAAKAREAEGWAAIARAQGWYEPDDTVDAALPYLCRDLGWDDLTWKANEHSFGLLLRMLEPGMRVLEVGAAKCWGARDVMKAGCAYVGTDILADENIGLGRGAFYEQEVGPFLRVQADGESLPFVDGAFDVTYCVATLHHALDLGRMVGEMGRVTRRGGHVLALNEGTRAVYRSGDAPDQVEERSYGINEHVHTLYGYVWAFVRAGLVVRRIEQADGYEEMAGRRIGGRLLRLPGIGRSAATWFTQTCYGYQGASFVTRRVRGR